MSKEEVYFIEVDQNGCSHCGAKRTWCVIGPGDVALGMTFESEEEASDLAEFMNLAYDQGFAAANVKKDQS